MKRLAGILMAGALLSGCVATNSTLVDPNTGTPYNCSAGGFGFIGVPVALAIQANCEKQMKDMGYVSMAEFQKSGGKISDKPVERSILTVISEPSGASILVGPNSDTVQTRLGTTPYQLQNPNGRLWAKECYQLKKDGYHDTEVRCYDQVLGDRAIEMSLTPISQ